MLVPFVCGVLVLAVMRIFMIRMDREDEKEHAAPTPIQAPPDSPVHVIPAATPEAERAGLPIAMQERFARANGAVGGAVGLLLFLVYLNANPMERQAMAADGHSPWSPWQILFALPAALAGAVFGLLLGLALHGRRIDKALQAKPPN